MFGTEKLHCVPKKHVTVSSTITWTRIVRLQQFLAHLLLSVLIIDRRFYFPTWPISCTYFTLGNCRDLNVCKKNLTKSWKFHRKIRFWFKISICQSSMMHEGCWVNFLTMVWKLEALTVCRRESPRRLHLFCGKQALADRAFVTQQ